MHIPDWDSRFLSEFDPDQYVGTLAKSRAQSIVLYAHSHAGLFNYPTKVGQHHRGLKGRDAVRELTDRCHAKGIAVVLYVSLIFDRWAADQHPEWRMRTHDGKIQGEGGRHGVLCVNSPYRDYARAFVAELCERYEFEGLRCDMTFWPWLCYCGHCQRRFAAEVGGELPRSVNWLDERWVAFQRRREAWLVEFATLITGTARRLKPAVTVEHQSSTFPLNWMFGVTAPLARQNDFLQGDFYGDALQGSFVRKLLEDLTPNRPFAYETSFSVELRDHTARKPEPLLEAKAAAAIADHAAFVFIDAIDPVGTVNPHPHERMGRVFERLMPYYEHLGGERVADVLVYYSLESKWSMAGSGRAVSQPDTSDTHTASSMQAARRLIAGHLPWGVVTRPNLPKLEGSRVLVLANTPVLEDEEAERIRAWVRGGGALYASGPAGLLDQGGRLRMEFPLSDVLGVSLKRLDWSSREHYVTPTAAGKALFPDFDMKYPAFAATPYMEVAARPGARVLATTTLPWPAPDPSKFASIHSNPPWQPTANDEVVLNSFGKGKALYCSTPLESVEVLAESFVRLLRHLQPNYTFEADAHPAVEITLFHQPERRRYLLTLVNFQKDLPNLPVEGIRLRLGLPQRVRRIRALPAGKSIPFDDGDGVVAFNAPRLATMAMLAVETA